MVNTRRFQWISGTISNPKLSLLVSLLFVSHLAVCHSVDSSFSLSVRQSVSQTVNKSEIGHVCHWIFPSVLRSVSQIILSPIQSVTQMTQPGILTTYFVGWSLNRSVTQLLSSYSFSQADQFCIRFASQSICYQMTSTISGSFDRLVVLVIQSDGQPAYLSVCLSTVRIRTQT